MRIPTDEDYSAFDGAHCANKWRSLSHSWRCPGCQRTKRQIMRWTKRNPNNKGVFWGWLAAFHTHHDHGEDTWGAGGRFDHTIICDHCNMADANAKRNLGLPANFSFSPNEISQFIKATPHKGHELDYQKAMAIFVRLLEQTTALDRDVK